MMQQSHRRTFSMAEACRSMRDSRKAGGHAGMTNIKACLGYIKETGSSKGRGVFASRRISTGELVEACPVVLLSPYWAQFPEELKRLLFNWGHLTKGEPAGCLALGWGSMYNHANPANLRYVALAEQQQLHFIAARDIEIHEELTINYNHTGGNVSSTDDVWFRKHGVALIS